MNSAVMRIPLRVVFYFEEDAWTAHCLEFDLVGTGASKNEALAMLTEAIEVQAAFSFDTGNLENLFTPADGKYFLMWAKGRYVTQGELHLQPISVEGIEGIDAREFCNGMTAA